MAPKEPAGSDKDTPANSGKDASKPAKQDMRPKPPAPHPQQLFGKGGKHPSNPMKGRSFRHQGR